MARRRLREVKRTRRFGNVLALRHGDKDAKLLQRHSAFAFAIQSAKSIISIEKIYWNDELPRPSYDPAPIPSFETRTRLWRPLHRAFRDSSAPNAHEEGVCHDVRGQGSSSGYGRRGQVACRDRSQFHAQ